MIQPIVLAAGKGTRMQSLLPKSLHPLVGRPLLGWVLDAFAGSGICRAPVVVVGHEATQVIAAAGPGAKIAVQAELNGSAMAAQAALAAVEGDAVLITNADQPFLRPETVRAMADAQGAPDRPLVLGVVSLEDFSGWRQAFVRFGRIVRDEMREPAKIVEYKNATDKERALLEVNPAVYAVDTEWLRDALARIQKNDVSGEYYITDLLMLARADGKRVAAVPMSPEEGYGINTQEELVQARILAQKGAAAAL